MRFAVLSALTRRLSRSNCKRAAISMGASDGLFYANVASERIDAPSASWIACKKPTRRGCATKRSMTFRMDPPQHGGRKA